MRQRGLTALAIATLAASIGLTSCSGLPRIATTQTAEVAAAAVEVPDVVGLDGKTAQKLLIEAGFDVDFDAGDSSVWAPGNWVVVATSPMAGTTADPSSTVLLSVARPEPEPEPVLEDEPGAVLDEINAAQFLAYAWEARFTYGGTVHWIADRITTNNGDGTWTFKIGATVKNEYGTKMRATIEGDVGGTNDAPVILDSILYTDSGEIISY